MTTNLNDTSNCPLDPNCVSCTGSEDLRVATWDTPMGVICRTVCGNCVGSRRLPRMSLPRAEVLALEHCEHLGIDLDQMAAIRAEEGKER
jgi:predicted metal-binding protein